jgi:CheY-like chemotaxis protein
MTTMARRVLAVEDSRTQAERLRLLLTAEGYEVEVAPDGREGLAAARARLPELIVSDVTMPEMDGFAFCQAVKSSPATRHIPFILLTARASPADIIRGWSAAPTTSSRSPTRTTTCSAGSAGSSSSSSCASATGWRWRWRSPCGTGGWW